MSEQEHKVLKEQRNRRKRVQHIRIGIITVISVWMILSIVITCILCAKVVSLQKQINILTGDYDSSTAVSAKVNQSASDTADIKLTQNTSDKENLATAEDLHKVYLTFDDGPSPAWTPQLLDGLKERNVKATFFLIGENAKNNPELVKREAEEGHLIGNHTYHHVEITRVPDETAQEEILMTNEVITGITGEEVSYMRPPFGVWQKNLERKLDVMPVLWTIDPLDWTTDNEDEIINKVVTQAGENDIILLHDCYESSVNAALRIVDILQKEGFEFVTVDELIMN